LRVKCLQALMNLGFNINDDHPLPHKNYSDFVKLFKPLRDGPEGLSFVDSLVDLCKKDYFFGYMGRDCETLLNKVFLPQKDDKKKPLPYLLRISITQGISFVISSVKVGGGAIDHMIVKPEQYAAQGIASYVEEHAKKRKLGVAKGVDRDFQIKVFGKYTKLEEVEDTKQRAYDSSKGGGSSTFMSSSSTKREVIH